MTTDAGDNDPVRLQQRSRLVDHFKRAYQIIVGLAITQACVKLFPNGLAAPDITLWLFCTFFITVVPIFHGGDRSLDIKYLEEKPKGFWKQAYYVWDVYMLLITAIFFVKIAQAIPGPVPAAVSTILGQGTSSVPAATPERFYEWMAAMLVFDVFVLAIDGMKTRKDELQAYIKWIGLNLLLAVSCYLAAFPPAFLPAATPEAVAIIVLGIATARTIFDYVFGKDFMFP